MSLVYGAPHLVNVNCLWCKCGFQARAVDVKRGWGKYCSKSCKATHQTANNRRGPNTAVLKKKSDKVFQAAIKRDETFEEYDRLCMEEDNA